MKFRIDNLQYCNWSRKIFEINREADLDAVHVTIVYHEDYDELLIEVQKWEKLFKDNSDLIFLGKSYKDIEKANKIAAERMGQIGIDVRDPSQAVGTMSGGERQCLAISRAIYFGAKVLVLDEPTSALGVHQASMVLKYVVKAASEGLAVILITHNVHHAYPVGNSFTVLNRGRSLGTFSKKDISREELLGMMAGGEELDKLEVELKEMGRLNS